MDRRTPNHRLDAIDHGIVLRHGDAEFADVAGARDVWVWEHDGRYRMHYDAAGEQGWLAALATSADGMTWKKHGPVLDLGDSAEPDSGSASFGTVFRSGDRWHMFYLGTPNVSDDAIKTPAFPYLTLKAASQSDVGPWVKDRSVRPFSTAPETYYSIVASPGAIIEVNGAFVMIFSSSTETPEGNVLRTLGVARTTDLDAAWIVDPSPLLPLNEQVENSSIYFEPTTSTWFLFTNHVGLMEGASASASLTTFEYTDAIWMYWATSPLGFTPANSAIVLDRENCTWSPRVIGLPSVIPIGDRLAIYYDGSEHDSISHGARDIGLAWLDLPLRPPFWA